MLLTLLWAVLTLPSLGIAPLFDYDETIYAQTALDMMHLGEWVVPTANGIQFFEKPPFTYYLMDLCFSIFGENSFAARLPSAIFTLLTAIVLLNFGTRIHSRKFGLSSALIFLTMLEVGILAHAAILDAVLNFFIATSLLYYILWRQSQSWRDALWVAFMMGAAVSIKGPVGAVIPFLVIVIEGLWSKTLWQTLRTIPWASCLTLFLIAALPWYLIIWINHGTQFLYEFIWVHNIGRALNPMQGHGGGWHYYLLVFMISTLPWFALVPASIMQCLRQPTDHPFSHIGRIAVIWIVIVIILFTVAQTKLPHYISCIYPGVALLIAMFLFQVRAQSIASSQTARAIVLITMIPLAFALIAFPAIYPILTENITHPRAIAIVQQAILPSWSISLWGIAMLASIIWSIQSTIQQATMVRMAIVGILFQSTLLFGIAHFAGQLMQAPMMKIATQLQTLPQDMPIYSYKLNAPSISFYSGRNFHLVTESDLPDFTQQPMAIFLRNESLAELPWLQQQQPLITQGGYLLYQLNRPN
ncbi:MAG: glycosyltransferase family 39 protein [Zetaproteobacteria bacterium]|nr:glycosyltransferase family 39 protein [Zetaproteobacteria bacterium]